MNWELWNVFLENPLIGNPMVAESTSNSYLLVLARMGMLGGILLALLILSVIKVLYLTWINKNDDVKYATFLSVMCSIAVYSLFEGVLIENYSLGQCVFFLCLTYFSSWECNYK